MSNPNIRVIYDDIGDVLYIWIGKHPRARNEEDEDGLYLRYDSDTNLPVGAMAVDFKEYWTPKHNHLVERISDFLGLSKSQIDKAIQRRLVLTTDTPESRT